MLLPLSFPTLACPSCCYLSAVPLLLLLPIESDSAEPHLPKVLMQLLVGLIGSPRLQDYPRPWRVATAQVPVAVPLSDIHLDLVSL